MTAFRSSRRPAPTLNPQHSTNPHATRHARSYQDVEKVAVDRAAWPCHVTTVSPSLHDLAFYQGLVANPSNFSDDAACSVFHLDAEDCGHWTRFKSSSAFNNYLTRLDTPSRGPPRVRAFFLTIEQFDGSNYRHRISLDRANAQLLLSKYNVCPQYLPFMLGKPDYWAPLDIHGSKITTKSQRVEFICQHPRYDVLKNQKPCSVYMGYDTSAETTTYIIVTGEDEPYVKEVKRRLSDSFPSIGTRVPEVQHGKDPFLLHSLLAHQSLTTSDGVITELKGKLYDCLDEVDAYAKTPGDRRNLQHLTNKLHGVSQLADSLSASAEMGIMIATRLFKAHERLMELFPDVVDSTSMVADSLSYLKESLESQRRWILSYKARKDISMNLVYNLVTQQDMEVNTRIARDTKSDSASMKVIAALTMLFLPATAVSSFFGMTFFSVAGHGDWYVCSRWWLFLATTIPLTAFTFSMWWLWTPVENFLRNFDLGSLLRKSDIEIIDEEKAVSVNEKSSEAKLK